ncbi:MAG: HNH endonuclease [Ignavibacteria bacterium]|nr:HNH endonuclease [Ignavibacteria bacterium]
MTDRKEYMKEYYIVNKDKAKEYRQKNKDNMKEYMKEYRGKNKDKIKEYREKNKDNTKKYMEEYRQKNKDKAKEYHEKNKDKKREYMKEYSKNNKDKIKEKDKKYRIANRHVKINSDHKRRLKMKFTDIDSKWLKQLYEDTIICEVCNRKMKDKSIDHILPLNVGGLHIKSNVRIICLKCNLQRPKNGSDIIQFRLL